MKCYKKSVSFKKREVFMKKIVKVFCVMSAFLFGGIFALSANPLEYKNALGIYGLAPQSVGGLQYQRWFNDRLGAQFQVFGAYSNSSHYNESTNSYIPNYSFSASAEFQVNLFETAISEKTAVRLFGWGLAGYYGHNEIDSDYIESSGEEGTESYVAGYFVYSDSGLLSRINLGFGFGFEFMFLNRISIPLEFGFAGSFLDDTGVSFSVGSGLRFRF